MKGDLVSGAPRRQWQVEEGLLIARRDAPGPLPPRTGPRFRYIGSRFGLRLGLCPLQRNVVKRPCEESFVKIPGDPKWSARDDGMRGGAGRHPLPAGTAGHWPARERPEAVRLHSLKPCAVPQSPRVPPVCLCPLLQSHLRSCRGICKRPPRGGAFGAADVGSGSIRVRHADWELSLSLRGRALTSWGSAVPRIADPQAGAACRAGCQLVGAHREYARCRRTAPDAAQLPLVLRVRLTTQCRCGATRLPSWRGEPAMGTCPRP